jgi:primase-polymerase (primpol)-like protein
MLTQESIPEELVERPQWVCWRRAERDGKSTKIPVVPGVGSFASSTDPETWSDFETALGYLERGRANGIGFVFTEEDTIVGVDLDDCRDPESGDVDDDAQDIITRLDSYTEVSPSGTGYHVLIHGELPDGRNRRGKIECYDKARFFTVTGDRVAATPRDVAHRQDALEAIHREYLADEESTQLTDNPKRVTQRDEAPSSTSLDDDTLLKKAKRASNGEKFERLWNGNTMGYDSNSEADMALCCLLAFWTGGDTQQLERLFRQSGLIREKWDEVHYADGSTYGEKTVERAISNTSEYYDPGTGSDSSDTHTPSESPPDVGDDIDRDQAYLVEKNRLLADRVDALEATLEQKHERIETLEREVQQLKDELANRERAVTETSREDADDASERFEAETEEPASVWNRTKQWLGSDSE